MKQSNSQPGQLMVDVAGTTLTAEEIIRIQNPLVGGIILFSRNYESPEQLSNLTAAIKQARGGPILIAADQEGGRVQRFKTNGFTPIPDMLSFGHKFNAQDNPQNQQEVRAELRNAAWVLACELRACGVNFSFAPVLDLDYQHSTVIGNRSLGCDVLQVTHLAKEVMAGFAKAGMGACGKHFPGHGFAVADSHIEIPHDNRSYAEISQADMAPYTSLVCKPNNENDDLGASLAGIMPAHVIYGSVDFRPAGFSGFWLNNVLRTRLGFQGVVFSDDLSMEGASVAGNYKQRVMVALKTGCDMALICNQPQEADAVLQQLVDLRMKPESLARIAKLIPKQEFMSWDELMQDEQYQHAKQRLQSSI